MKRLLLFALLILAASCEKKATEEEIDWNDGKIRDGDGNVYTEIVVGDQTWLREDLRTSKLNDRVTKLKESATVKAEVAYHVITGVYYYSLDAALLPNICPMGYRVPSREEFQSIPKKDIFPHFGDWWTTTIETSSSGIRGGYYLDYYSIDTGFVIHWHNDTYKHPIRCIKKTES